MIKPDKRDSGTKGFTIIELVIVLSITGVVLFFSIPTFKNVHIFSDPAYALGKTIGLIDRLKIKAMADNRDYLMHVDIAVGLIWVSEESMDEEAIKQARENSIQFSGDTVLLDVEFPKTMPFTADEVQIRFNRKGYSDMALIHIQEGESRFTLRIEPFLSKVEVENRSASFEQCM